MSQHPKLVPWKSPNELLALRSLFFPEDEVAGEQRSASYREAISIVHLYSSRTRIPHTLQSTAHLFSVLMLMDGGDEESIRLAASMTLIRFVNGLLDPNQQSQFAIPLQVLARKIGLPSWFVEFRHAATHDSLPSLEMCEECIRGAIEWTWIHYWSQMHPSEPVELEMEDEDDKERRLRELFKQYRRIRRQDINRFIKFGDSSPLGREYWDCINSIRSHVGHDGFHSVMVERIISTKLKWEQLKLLYEPMMNHFIQLKSSDMMNEFPLGLIDCLLTKSYEYTKLKGVQSTSLNSDEEYNCAQKWLKWIVLQKRYDEMTQSKIIDVLGKNMENVNLSLLEQFRDLVPRNLQLRIDSKVEQLNRVLETSKRVHEITDIMTDLESLKKRAKLAQAIPVKSFQRHDQWTPKPFGVI